jgi:hypothetical protein
MHRNRFNRRWLRDGYAVHRHLPHAGKSMVLDDAQVPIKFAVILRHPKNVLVSRARRAAAIKSNTITPTMAIKTHLTSGAVRPLFDPKRQLDWQGWVTDPAACVVRFEELTAQSADIQLAAIARLRDYLEINLISPDEVAKHLLGESPTWSGRNSDWMEHWDAEIETLFIAAGGYGVMRAFGYE